MRDIYWQAGLVVAWLRMERETDARGFKFMRTLHDTIKMPTRKDMGLTDFSQREGLGVPGIAAREWAALCGILYRPYISWAWTVQEIVVAESCIFRCGSIMVEQDIVPGAAAIIEKLHCLKPRIASNVAMESDSTQAVCYSARDLWFVNSMLDCGEGLNIFELLCHTKIFKASEDRDKIFALVGLASNLDSTFIDYNKDLSDILIQIAKICLFDEESWGASLLSCVDSTRHPDNLPSWVIDCTNGPLQVLLASGFCPVRSVQRLGANWRCSSGKVIEPDSFYTYSIR